MSKYEYRLNGQKLTRLPPGWYEPSRVVQESNIAITIHDPQTGAWIPCEQWFINEESASTKN